MAEKIVIVGAGQAGASLAEALRARGFHGAVTLVGEEPAPPYQRPPLSKAYLKGELAPDRLWLKPPEFWPDHRIALITGVAVAAIDRALREVRLADGRALPYDRLALTTGARPRRLPAPLGGGLAGVHVLRTLADVDAMAHQFAPGRRALIVGGGYIGLEAAAVAAGRGLKATLIEAAPRILGRVAAAATADHIRALHRAHGVEVREGATLARLRGAGGRVAEAELEGGERIAVDFALVGIGVEPDVALARAAGLEIENGVAVDARCATSDPAIFAAGDCVSFPFRGARVRLESVQNAIDQGRAAAAAMLGERAPYAPVPWFWSDQYDAKLQIAGLNLGHDRVEARPGQRPGSLVVEYFRGDELLAVDAVNDPRAYMTAKRALEAARPG